MSPLQKQIIERIINIFETGSKVFKFDKIVYNKNDAGGLSYGAFQISLNSGNLYKLILSYTNKENCLFKVEFIPYLDKLKNKDKEINFDSKFKDLLLEASFDECMVACQMGYLDENFWPICLNRCKNFDLDLALSVAVIFDTCIQGSFFPIKEKLSQKDWIIKYIYNRKKWLKSRGELLYNSIYRMESFERIIDEGNWDLNLPLYVRGLKLELGDFL